MRKFKYTYRAMRSLIITIPLSLLVICGLAYSAESGKPEAHQSSDAHILCEKSLQKMLKMEKSVFKSIEKHDLSLLRTQLSDLEAGIMDAREKMDKALLIGAWKSRELKKMGHELSDRLETLRVLNFMGLAFTSNYYPNSTKKVSASVTDSLQRFFVQLKSLAQHVEEINKAA